MSHYLIRNARVLTRAGFNGLQSVEVHDGCIAGIFDDTEVEDRGEQTGYVDFEGDILAPGLFDIQVNGGGGVLFNDNRTVDGLNTIARAHRQFGVTAFLPTLISDHPEAIGEGISAVRRAMRSADTTVAGIHIEGPCISPEKRGIHPISRVRPLDDELLELFSSLDEGHTLVTLAPEAATPAQISRLSERGVVVSLGHSQASYEQTVAALNAGATGFTHLFNAMSPLTSREPGMVGAALETTDNWAGIIMDGVHVSSVALSLALKLKTAKKLILVSDAMPDAGADLPTFELLGREIIVSDGRLTSADDGTLAGAALNLAQAVHNSSAILNVDDCDAIRMASTNPAAFMGADDEHGEIAIGRKANLVRFDKALKLKGTCLAGVWDI